MSESLYSESWYRVANLTPRIRKHAQIHRHVYRDEVWYVLQDHSTGRFHRFSPTANLLIGLMDGTRSVQQIWDLAMTRLGRDVPPQDEVIKLLSDLHRADVLQTDIRPDLDELQKRREMHASMRIKQYIGNPMSLRFPLLDPNRMLERWMPTLRPLFGWFGALLWLTVVAIGSVLAAMHWTELSSGALDRVFTVRNLFLIWLIFPVVKSAHELGHAISVKAAGGEVHEMGVMLLLMMPIPYVDASAASAFSQRRWRALTGAAGMLVELFIAALAMIAWSFLEPNAYRAVAYNILVITGISTLLFNGNPLLRYDGYYILADWVEIPNLAQRAGEYLSYLFRRYLLGIDGVPTPFAARGEKAWFIFYGVAAVLYRSFITITIIWVISSRMFLVGILLAIWCIYVMVLQPTVQKLGATFGGGTWRLRNVRVWGSALLMVLAVLLALFVVPAPSLTRSEGVIWIPPQSEVRAGVDGFISRVAVASGEPVTKGQLLMTLVDRKLQAQFEEITAEIEELQARSSLANATNRVNAGIVDEQLAHARDAERVTQQRLARLNLYSQSDGTFVMDDPADATGRYVQRGDLLAFIAPRNTDLVRVVISQADEAQVREGTLGAKIRSADRPQEVFPATIVREVPAATDELPSMALSLEGGGTIGIDPTHPQENRAIEKLFVLDLSVPTDAKLTHLGGRVYVVFEHRREPLAFQLVRGMRRLLLKKFDA